MEKKHLKDYFRHNDYSYLEIKRMRGRFQLNDLINNTGFYKRFRTNEAIASIIKLCKMPLSEYFKFMPEAIRLLYELPEFRDLDDLESMTVGEVFLITGGIKDDYSEDYLRDDAVAEICEIMIRVITDSGFEHPLYQSLFMHINEVANQIAGKELFNTAIYGQKFQTSSINSFLKENYTKNPKACCLTYFNRILVPAYAIIVNSEIL